MAGSWANTAARAVTVCGILLLLAVTGPRSPGATPPLPSRAKTPAVAALPELPENVKLLPDQKYGPAAGVANLMDVYLPRTPSAAPLPVVVWVHGGAWIAGDKRQPFPAVPLVGHGYVVASINYRFATEARYPAQIQDCKGAIRYLRAHAKDLHIDPDRVGVWGASAGGHLVALLGTSAGDPALEGTVGGNPTQSSRVQAVCDWFGPTDLSQFHDQAVASGILNVIPGPPLLRDLFGGTLAEKRALVQQANPVAFVKKAGAAGGKAAFPPFLVMHGDKDPLVPVAQSRLLVDAVKAVGGTIEFRVLPGAGHGSGFDRPDVHGVVTAFFDRTLTRHR